MISIKFPYSQSAYMDITGLSAPGQALGEGETFSDIEVDLDAAGPPAYDSAVFKRIANPGADGLQFLEFELTEDASRRTYCYHVNRDLLRGTRLYVST